MTKNYKWRRKATLIVLDKMELSYSNGLYEREEGKVSPQEEWQKKYGDSWVDIPLIDLMLGGSKDDTHTRSK